MPAMNTNLCILILFFCTLNHRLCADFVDVDVGIVLDMESWLGKSIHSSIMMAISDFYARNHSYKTRIAVHTKDSKGDRLQALSAVLDLLNLVKVSTIIGPQTYIGSELLGSIADTSKVPIISFAGKSLTEYPYLLHIKEDEGSLAKSICALVESYKWRGVIYMYEESDQGSELLQNLFELFQDKNIQITYRIPISASAKNDQIIKVLHKVMSIHTMVIIVDMSPSLASRLFPNVKRLGMMSKEYAWILSQKTTDVFLSTKFEVIESFQGVLGFRSYVPTTRRLHYLTNTWNKKFSRKLHVLAIWAYDTIWALAESIEKVGVQQNGTLLLHEILKTKLKGLSGEFRLTERNVISNGFEIINAVDHGERKVGYWTLSKGITRTLLPLNDAVLHYGIGMEDVVWPGGSTTIPSDSTKPTSLGKKLRIGVRTGLTFSSFVHAVYDNQSEVTNATGFCVDVFNTCLQALPYEVTYELVPYMNGSYDKLIEKVFNKEIDGILGDTTILAKRLEFVDFTTTFTDLGLGTLAKTNTKDMWIFLKPLNANLWLTFTAFLIFNGLVIWAIEAMDQESKNSPSQGIGTIFWLVILTIFSAQKEKLVSNLSRFVMFVWLIVVLILISSYTATLTSLLTVEQFEIASKGGIVGFHGGSFFGGVMVNNTNFTGSNQRPYYSYEKYADALTKGGKHGGADAIVDEVPYIKMFLGKYSNGDYTMVSSEPVTSGFAFIFSKGSPLVKDISREIAKLREDGTLKLLEKKWFDTEFSVLPEDSSSTIQPKTLSVERFGGLFVISAASSCLAFFVSLIYLIRAKMNILIIVSLLGGRNLMSTVRYLLHEI
ncbi:glutamate receptor 1.4-like [Bidens hawaiensis]|uniref:glutamate receptor 1.4-like n=1 Tax=Bidens hawaiensis TaxID=980011 RepID=UPI00404B5F44